MTAAGQPSTPADVGPGEGPTQEVGWQEKVGQLASVVAALTSRVDAMASWATEAKGAISRLQQEGGGRGCDPLHGHKPTIEQQMALFGALAEWQATCPEFKKDRTATVQTEKSSYTYSYADLGQAAALAHTASKHGLSHFHVQIPGSQFPYIRCYLLHAEGGFIYADAPLIAKNSRGDRGAQDWGAGCTYARRFSLCMVLGIAAAEEDNDGEPAGGGGGRGYSTRPPARASSAPQARPSTSSAPPANRGTTTTTSTPSAAASGGAQPAAPGWSSPVTRQG